MVAARAFANAGERMRARIALQDSEMRRKSDAGNPASTAHCTSPGSVAKANVFGDVASPADPAFTALEARVSSPMRAQIAPEICKVDLLGGCCLSTTSRWRAE
jgi:hypothetical protein